MSRAETVDDLSEADAPEPLGHAARNIAFAVIREGAAGGPGRAGPAHPAARGRRRLLDSSRQGRERFRAFVRELWSWLVAEVEPGNGEPLDDQGREDLRTVARRQMLSDDPVTEPIELAPAGA